MATPDPVQDLVSRARADDPSARAALLEHCRPELVRFVSRKLPAYLRGQVAEDIVQDAYAVALGKVNAFEWRGPDPLGGFRAWLRKLVLGKYRNWRAYFTQLKRDYRRVVANPYEPDPDAGHPGVLEGAARDEDTPSRLARRRERADRLHAVMAAVLTPTECLAVRLRFLELLPVADAAALMECSAADVSALCYRAKKKLWEALRGQTSQFFSDR